MSGVNRSRSRIPQIRAVVSPLKRASKRELLPSTSPPKIPSGFAKTNVENGKEPRQRRLWHSMSSELPTFSHSEGSSFKRRHGAFGDFLTKEDMLQIAKDALENTEVIESVDECQFRREQAVFWLIRSLEMGCESAKDLMKSLLDQLPADSPLKYKLQKRLVQTRDQLEANQLGNRLFKDLARGKPFVSLWDLHQTLVQGCVSHDQQHSLFDEANESISCPKRIYCDTFVSACHDLVAHGDLPALDNDLTSMDNGNFHGADKSHGNYYNTRMTMSLVIPISITYLLWATIQSKTKEFFSFEQEHSNPTWNWVFSMAYLVYVCARHWHWKRRLHRWHRVLNGYQKDPDQSKMMLAKAKSWSDYSVEFPIFLCGASLMLTDPLGMSRESSPMEMLTQGLVISLCILSASYNILFDVFAIGIVTCLSHFKLSTFLPSIPDISLEVGILDEMFPLCQFPCDLSVLLVIAVSIFSFGTRRYLGLFLIKTFILGTILSELEPTKSSAFTRSAFDVDSNFLRYLLPTVVLSLMIQFTSLLAYQVTQRQKQTIWLAIVNLLATSSLILANLDLEPLRPSAVHPWNDFLRNCSMSAKPSQQIQCHQLSGHLFSDIHGQVESMVLVQRDLIPLLSYIGNIHPKHRWSCVLTLSIPEESYFPYGSGSNSKVDLVLPSTLWNHCLQINIKDMIRATGRLIPKDLTTRVIQIRNLTIIT